MIIDTHAHLNINTIIHDIDEVIERAFKQGVKSIIIPATDCSTSEEIIGICSKYNNLYAAVGIHPTDIKESGDKELQIIESLSHNKKVVAIGEIGLDYYWKPYDSSKQEYFLKAQLNIAKQNNLPVIIHNRDSSADLMQIIIDEYDNGRLRGQFHSFSGDSEMVKRCVEMNFFISFTGNITYKPNQLTFTAYGSLKSTPLENLLLETDSPFLPPVPCRGKRNEPSFIIYTAKKISELKGLDYEQLCSVTTDNAKKLFNI